MAWAWNTNTDENVQPSIDCETVTKYSAMIVAFPGHTHLLLI